MIKDSHYKDETVVYLNNGNPYSNTGKTTSRHHQNKLSIRCARLQIALYRAIFIVVSILLANICILASMFVWRFVCVSGWKITHNSRTRWHIFTKFHTQMRLGLVQMRLGLVRKYWFSNRSNKHTSQNVNLGKSASLRVRFHSGGGVPPVALIRIINNAHCISGGQLWNHWFL